MKTNEVTPKGYERNPEFESTMQKAIALKKVIRELTKKMTEVKGLKNLAHGESEKDISIFLLKKETELDTLLREASEKFGENFAETVLRKDLIALLKGREIDFSTALAKAIENGTIREVTDAERKMIESHRYADPFLKSSVDRRPTIFIPIVPYGLAKVTLLELRNLLWALSKDRRSYDVKVSLKEALKKTEAGKLTLESEVQLKGALTRLRLGVDVIPSTKVGGEVQVRVAYVFQGPRFLEGKTASLRKLPKGFRIKTEDRLLRVVLEAETLPIL